MTLPPPVCIQKLSREIRIWAQLSHPNVLPLLGYFVEGTGAMPSLVSEWMENGTLTEYIKRLPYCGEETLLMVRLYIRVVMLPFH